MEENKKPFVIMNLDKPRKFRMTLDAVIEMQERLEINIEKPDEFMEKLLNNPNKAEVFKFFRVIIYLGLHAEDQDVTEELVGYILDINNFNEAMVLAMAHMGIKLEIKSAKNLPRAVIPTRKPRRKSPGTGTLPSRKPAKSG